MLVEIDDLLGYKSAVVEFKKQWLKKKRYPSETITSLAKRMGLSRRGVQIILKNDDNKDYDLTYPLKYECEFCRSQEQLDLHHVHGRTKNEVIYLCPRCHHIFHGLQKAYKKPVKV